MANVFKSSQDVNRHPNRNNFDLSRQNHLTLKMGTLYPIFVQDCVPGDSFRIKTAYGLKFMPMPFPVQSKIKAHFYYFWIPNRILWKNSKNFLQGIGKNDANRTQIIHPYIDQPDSYFKTGTLADYLGLPTTVISLNAGVHIYKAYVPASFNTARYYSEPQHPVTLTDTFDGTIKPEEEGGTYQLNFKTPREVTETLRLLNRFFNFIPANGKVYEYGNNLNDVATVFHITNRIRPINHEFTPIYFEFSSGNGVDINTSVYQMYWRPASTGTDVLGGNKFEILNTSFFSYQSNSKKVEFQFDRADLEKLNNAIDQFGGIDILISLHRDNEAFMSYLPVSLNIHSLIDDFEEYSDMNIADGKSMKDLRINALPFRAYEMVYNSFFRNTQNQPYEVNGVRKYNEYIPTDGDGPDSNNYQLHVRNWENDFLTTALPAPQQGDAPLVGLIQGSVNAGIELENGNVVDAEFTWEQQPDGTLKSQVSITNPDDDADGSILSAAQIAAEGLSINDLRNVNALQQFLETNMRKGFRYFDFIEGHFGKGPTHQELDMPVFIGGFNEIVNINSVTQTSAGDDSSPLGSFAGQASLFGQSRTISHYCDDYGYIIGLVSIVPTPAYSQLLPKHFLKHSQLDYYFPEFAQIGMQPIPKKEVAPLQLMVENPNDYASKLEQTFGYQRPNYDMVASVDEIHGQFRIGHDVRNMLIQRIFGQFPELGNEFLTIDPLSVNNIFSYQSDDADNIVGQIVFDVVAKRPIPRIHIPTL